jgi:hypothetical protein
MYPYYKEFLGTVHRDSEKIFYEAIKKGVAVIQ